ncbi:12098_t:CDS:2 [Dentiscutata erythropus]|uniref:12098_t:CDS:1 n=1 Tax=Dentiscutata erythropus TaxID=1348616 RepID=A0A9N9I4E8_9GLOM|nr:12098_t:CDS:2 [Dentiscutata erythropus]
MNAYDNKEAGTLLLHDSVFVEHGSSVTNANDIPKYEMQFTRLARKEFRKLKKRHQHTHSEETTESTKAEEIKLNVERILWEARERHIDQENWEKTVKSIKLHKPPNITTIVNDANSVSNSVSNSSSAQMSSSISTVTTASSQEVMPLESDYGTEKVVYPEFSCGRYHSYPDKSVTILIKNMYEGMPVRLADEDNDDNLEYDEVEAERHYHEFFEDVHSEFQQYGTIVQFKVCNNFQMHLRGNVYVQFSKECEAEQAIKTIRGRWYAGKQLICEYCPVTNWRSAICGSYLG